MEYARSSTAMMVPSPMDRGAEGCRKAQAAAAAGLVNSALSPDGAD